MRASRVRPCHQNAMDADRWLDQRILRLAGQVALNLFRRGLKGIDPGAEHVASEADPIRDAPLAMEPGLMRTPLTLGAFRAVCPLTRGGVRKSCWRTGLKRAVA